MTLKKKRYSMGITRHPSGYFWTLSHFFPGRVRGP